MPLPVSFYILAFIFGAVVGSFLNVCIYRLPKRESVAFPPSHCPSCNFRIPFYDNIPILSYLVLKGKCRACGTAISSQYPVVEALNGLLTLFLFMKFGLSFPFIVLFLFCCAMVVITFIDLEHQIIPDIISLPGIVAGLLFSCAVTFYGWEHRLPGILVGWKGSLIGILVGGGSLYLVAYLYQLFTKKEGMGGGDIKLLAMMGAFFGWKAVPFIIFVSSLVGSIIGVSLMLIQQKDSKLAIPFGPFLAFGAILYIFFGRQMILWYLRVGGGAG